MLSEGGKGFEANDEGHEALQCFFIGPPYSATGRRYSRGLHSRLRLSTLLLALFAIDLTREVGSDTPQPSERFHSILLDEEIVPPRTLEYWSAPVRISRNILRHRCRGEVVDVSTVHRELEYGDVAVER